jgi:carbon monoxide dehydrogenase subunit G
MAEQLINEFTVNRPIDEAWTILTNIERIAPCLPGAELQEVEGEVYRGVVKVKLGAISSQFKGEANFLDRDDSNHTATIKGVGRDTGGRGNASAEITAKAESLSPTSTRVIVTTDLHITGKVAQFGRGIMGDVSSKLMGQFANNLNEMLDEQNLDGAPAEEPKAAEAADPVAAPLAEPATADEQPPAATEAPEAPKVRKINGPATEPIDLMEVGGSSIAKRVAPAIVALVVVLFLLRRRRS